jgi:hypothetical protein
MFQKIKENNGAVDFQKSITIGDSDTDVLAARRIGSIPIYLGDKNTYNDILCLKDLSDL